MKTKHLNLLVLGLSLIFFVACKDGNESAEPTAAQTENEVETPVAEEENVKVNPAHGLPGHRCDLPVGAPLTASAGSTQNPTPTSQLPSTSVSPIRVDQTPTVNPPHGEPGHDCTVPVGAKLE